VINFQRRYTCAGPTTISAVIIYARLGSVRKGAQTRGERAKLNQHRKLPLQTARAADVNDHWQPRAGIIGCGPRFPSPPVPPTASASPPLTLTSPLPRTRSLSPAIRRLILGVAELYRAPEKAETPVERPRVGPNYRGVKIITVISLGGVALGGPSIRLNCL
jgi:hypothetical protein